MPKTDILNVLESRGPNAHFAFLKTKSDEVGEDNELLLWAAAQSFSVHFSKDKIPVTSFITERTRMKLSVTR